MTIARPERRTTDHWTVVAEVRSLDSQTQFERLEQLCGTNPQLRRGVESLPAAHNPTIVGDTSGVNRIRHLENNTRLAYNRLGLNPVGGSK
jgi:hypothetical protein